ncbi:MAG: hypothetical protein Kow0076_6350 [Francisella sp.]
MNKNLIYAIELCLVLIITFTMIYDDQNYSQKKSVKTKAKTIIIDHKFDNAKSISINCPNKIKDIKYISKNASNIRILKENDKLIIQCAKGYTPLGDFPKPNNYIKYKCTQMPCNIEVTRIDYFNNDQNVFASLEKENYKNNIQEIGTFYFDKDNDITAVAACVPKDQLKHWREHHWYNLF